MLVEASIIIPILLILTFSVIWLSMDFFTETVEETRGDNVVFHEGFDEGSQLRRATLIGDLIHEDE